MFVRFVIKDASGVFFIYWLGNFYGVLLRHVIAGQAKLFDG
jgi:hypothetical protein